MADRDRMEQAIKRAKEYWESTVSVSADGIRILVAGDLHFNKVQFQWLEEQKENFECFCLTGDFLGDHSGIFEEQTVWVSNWLKKLDKHVFICSGNHDLDEFAECRWLSNMKNPKICRDNQKKLFNGIKFGCIPYLGGDLSAFHDCDVLLSHVPPIKTATSRSMVSGKPKDWGDKELYYALQGRVVTPHYILCGHVENPSANRDCLFGVEIINPGGEHGSSIPGHARIVIPKLSMSNSGTPSV